MCLSQTTSWMMITGRKVSLSTRFRPFVWHGLGLFRPAPCADLLAEEGGGNKSGKRKNCCSEATTSGNKKRNQWVCSSRQFVQMQRFLPRRGLSCRHCEAFGSRPTSMAPWCNIVYKAKKGQEGWRSGLSAGSQAGLSPQFGSSSRV